MVFTGIWFIFRGQNRVPYNREPVYFARLCKTLYQMLCVLPAPENGQTRTKLSTLTHPRDIGRAQQ